MQNRIKTLDNMDFYFIALSDKVIIITTDFRQKNYGMS
jgi:hypothetical protein